MENLYDLSFFTGPAVYKSVVFKRKMPDTLAGSNELALMEIFFGSCTSYYTLGQHIPLYTNGFGYTFQSARL